MIRLFSGSVLELSDGWVRAKHAPLFMVHTCLSYEEKIEDA